MKLRLFVAALLLAASFFCAWFSYGVIKKESGELISMLEVALDGTDAAFFSQTALACARWDELCPRFFVLMHHRDADELAHAFFKLARNVAERQPEKTREAALECLSLLRILRDGEAPLLPNILTFHL